MLNFRSVGKEAEDVEVETVEVLLVTELHQCCLPSGVHPKDYKSIPFILSY
jgi:hypothetical protein